MLNSNEVTLCNFYRYPGVQSHIYSVTPFVNGLRGPNIVYVALLLQRIDTSHDLVRLVHKVQEYHGERRLLLSFTPTMSYQIYNSLDFLDTANEKFRPHRGILCDPELISLFKRYRQYGVCLVHRHYDIREGELVVTDDSTTQPLEENGTYYPERWLPNGTAYEFNTKLGEVKIDETLLREFQEILKRYVGLKSLGIFFIYSELETGRVMLEETDAVARRSETREVDLGENIQGSVETNWIPGSSASPLYCICTPHCRPSRVDREPKRENWYADNSL
jgi:hypothetical protein